MSAPAGGFVAVFTHTSRQMATVQEVLLNGERTTVCLIGDTDPDEANDRAAFIADALNRRAADDAAREYRCTGCGWIGEYEEINHLRAGEDDILDQCPECESVESMKLNESAP